jgi:ribonuclease VapC
LSASETPVYLLDSWAVLAYLKDEPAAPAVESILVDAEESRARCCMSLINAGEVLYSLARRTGWEQAEATLDRLRAIPVEIIGVTEPQVVAAARIKSRNRLSYADAFAVAVAQERNAILVTGDPEIAGLPEPVKIRDIRPQSNTERSAAADPKDNA